MRITPVPCQSCVKENILANLSRMAVSHIPLARHTFHSRLIMEIQRALSFSNVRNGMCLSTFPRISKEIIVEVSSSSIQNHFRARSSEVNAVLKSYWRSMGS